MKLAKNWRKAFSTWAAALIIALPNIAGALGDLAPYLGEHGKTVLTISGILFFIARVWPQPEVDGE